jgi:hypothetical protein
MAKLQNEYNLLVAPAPSRIFSMLCLSSFGVDDDDDVSTPNVVVFVDELSPRDRNNRLIEHTVGAFDRLQIASSTSRLRIAFAHNDGFSLL